MTGTARRSPALAAILLLALPALLGAADILLPNRDGALRLAVIGDSGSGTRGQYETAGELVNAHTKFPFDLVLMLGDNIYGGQNPRDLFLKFEQLETGNGRPPGTGVGLALTRKIVEAQGGSVGVRSRIGEGSVFHAVLPRHSPGARASR